MLSSEEDKEEDQDEKIKLRLLIFLFFGWSDSAMSKRAEKKFGAGTF